MVWCLRRYSVHGKNILTVRLPVVCAALLRIDHGSDLLLCGQPEAWLHHPPVRVRASPVELSTGFQTFPEQRLTG
jgi:hypothetical protein